MTNVEQYVKPELLILIPVLYFVGAMIKKSKMIADENIPLIVGTVGVVLATLYTMATTAPHNWFQSIFVGITQGILCAGCSVYANQLIKQETQRKSDEQ